MKSLILKFFNWWKKRKKIKKYSKVIYINSLSSVPKKLGKKIYVVGTKNEVQKWVVFTCPCPQKNRIEVNLMKSRKPFWVLTLANEKVSLSPSVIVTKTCNCHFWMRNSKAYIC